MESVEGREAQENVERTENAGTEGEDVRHPEPEQSPVATERNKAIQGDPGFGEGQAPQSVAANADAPFAQSPPPPAAQSGVPLQEDRDAGVEPGARGPLVSETGSTSEPVPGDALQSGGRVTGPVGGQPGEEPGEEPEAAE